MYNCTINCSETPENVYSELANFFLDQSNKFIKEKGFFSVVLSGGTTPEPLYHLLASHQYTKNIAWKKIHFFFSDERIVSKNHPDSNYGMAQKALFDRVDIPFENIHPMYEEQKVLEDACLSYEEQINNLLKKDGQGFPVFDLVLLGIGEDGHTASLFPEVKVEENNHSLVAAVYIEKLASWRMTLTFLALTHARQIIFLATGERKKNIINEILNKKSVDYPVSKIIAKNNTLWFVDKSATGDSVVSTCK